MWGLVRYVLTLGGEYEHTKAGDWAVFIPATNGNCAGASSLGSAYASPALTCCSHLSCHFSSPAGRVLAVTGWISSLTRVLQVWWAALR